MENPIVKLRNKMGISETALADKIKVSQSALNNHCQGRSCIGSRLMAKYAKAGVSVEEMMEWNKHLLEEK